MTARKRFVALAALALFSACSSNDRVHSSYKRRPSTQGDLASSSSSVKFGGRNYVDTESHQPQPRGAEDADVSGGQASCHSLPAVGSYSFDVKMKQAGETRDYTGVWHPLPTREDPFIYSALVSGTGTQRSVKWEQKNGQKDDLAQRFEIECRDSGLFNGLMDTRVGGSIPPAEWSEVPQVIGALDVGSAWPLAARGITHDLDKDRRVELTGRATVVAKTSARIPAETTAWQIHREWTAKKTDSSGVTSTLVGKSDEVYVPILGLATHLTTHIETDSPTARLVVDYTSDIRL